MAADYFPNLQKTLTHRFRNSESASQDVYSKNHTSWHYNKNAEKQRKSISKFS